MALKSPLANEKHTIVIVISNTTTGHLDLSSFNKMFHLSKQRSLSLSAWNRNTERQGRGAALFIIWAPVFKILLTVLFYSALDDLYIAGANTKPFVFQPFVLLAYQICA